MTESTEAKHSTPLERLERLAKDATPGPWTLVYDDENRPYAIMIWDDERVFTEQIRIVECRLGCATDQGRADYSYIAACSPEVVAALVTVARAAYSLTTNEIDALDAQRRGRLEETLRDLSRALPESSP